MKSIAVIGAGNFSTFALPQMLEHDETVFSGILDSDQEKAKAFQAKFGGRIYSGLDEVTKDQKIDLVYIATPPWGHYPYAKECLLAGKHVICEKPAALHIEEVRDLIRIAKEKNSLYVVNLMQRYNPLFHIVKKIIDDQLLGAFLHGFFENYASDEFLDPAHWFWEEKKSGGIFIEHAVHFFDLFEGWFGKGKLLNALEMKRTNSPIQDKAADRVQAVVQYGDAIVNFYHGFDQPKKLDRQEIRLVFEKGNINLYEWVPNKMKMEAILTKQDLEAMESFISPIEISIKETYSGDEKKARGRFKDISSDLKVEIVHQGSSKMATYRRLVADLFADQLKWIADPGHERIITEENAFNSLQMAVEAHQSAEIIA
jgi:predicted dehydrogenase